MLSDLNVESMSCAAIVVTADWDMMCYFLEVSFVFDLAQGQAYQQRASFKRRKYLASQNVPDHTAK